MVDPQGSRVSALAEQLGTLAARLNCGGALAQRILAAGRCGHERRFAVRKVTGGEARFVRYAEGSGASLECPPQGPDLVELTVAAGCCPGGPDTPIPNTDWIFPFRQDGEDEQSTGLSELSFLARALKDVVQQRTIELESRLKLAEARASVLQDRSRAGSARERTEALRQQVQESLLAFRDGLEERLQAALHLKDAEALVNQFSGDCLIAEDSGKGQRLVVDPVYLGRVDRALQTPCLDALGREHASLERVSDSLSAKLADALGVGRAAVEAPLPDQHGVWNQTRSRLQIETGIQVDRPQRKFIQRIAEGRRPLYMIMMMVSLFGAPFGLRRGPAIAIVMAILFLGGILMTYRSWRIQDSEQREQIATDAREKLRVAIGRSRDDYCRAVSAAYNTAVNEVGRDMQRRVDEIAKSTADKQARLNGEEAASTRAQISRASHELDQAQAFGRELGEAASVIDSALAALRQS